MKKITWTDMFICILILIAGAGALIVVGVHLNIGVPMVRFFLGMWCVCWPLVYGKIKWVGEDPEEKKPVKRKEVW